MKNVLLGLILLQIVVLPKDHKESNYLKPKYYFAGDVVELMCETDTAYGAWHYRNQSGEQDDEDVLCDRAQCINRCTETKYLCFEREYSAKIGNYTHKILIPSVQERDAGLYKFHVFMEQGELTFHCGYEVHVRAESVLVQKITNLTHLVEGLIDSNSALKENFNSLQKIVISILVVVIGMGIIYISDKVFPSLREHLQTWVSCACGKVISKQNKSDSDSTVVTMQDSDIGLRYHDVSRSITNLPLPNDDADMSDTDDEGRREDVDLVNTI